jgi:hypothetical protein
MSLRFVQMGKLMSSFRIAYADESTDAELVSPGQGSGKSASAVNAQIGGDVVNADLYCLTRLIDKPTGGISMDARLLLRRACVLGIGLLASTAFASPIEFIHTGSGSGSINGVSFSQAAFTIDDFADTTAVQACGAQCLLVNDTSASITISGVGSFTFVTPTHTFVNNGLDLVGFSRGAGDLYNGPTNSAFAGYGLASAIGPITGSGSLVQWTTAPVVTSGGTLVFNTATTDATFQAITMTTAVPEPATDALMLFGLAAIIPFVRSRGKPSSH